MTYKAKFRPSEVLRNGQWIALVEKPVEARAVEAVLG